jgi:hypothetical protein
VLKWQITFEEFCISSEAEGSGGNTLWNDSEEAGNGRDCPVVPHVFV